MRPRLCVGRRRHHDLLCCGSVGDRHECPDRLRRPHPCRIDCGRAADQFPGADDRSGRIRAKAGHDTCAKRCRAKYEYEPHQASLLASSRRFASPLWQPPCSHLSPGATVHHCSPPPRHPIDERREDRTRATARGRGPRASRPGHDRQAARLSRNGSRLARRLRCPLPRMANGLESSHHLRRRAVCGLSGCRRAGTDARDSTQSPLPADIVLLLFTTIVGLGLAWEAASCRSKHASC